MVDEDASINVVTTVIITAGIHSLVSLSVCLTSNGTMENQISLRSEYRQFQARNGHGILVHLGNQYSYFIGCVRIIISKKAFQA